MRHRLAQSLADVVAAEDPGNLLFKSFADVFTGYLVVSQNEDSAVFDGISIDIAAEGTDAPYSEIAAVFRRSFRL